MAALRKSLQRFAEDLQLFSGQLAQETAELKRNVEHRPVIGATNFRHCLEDLNDRLGAVAEELQALEAISLDAISLEELVGHCCALYAENHAAIAQLEQRLQQFAYRDVYAPLPPENPLDMLPVLRSGGGAGATHGAAVAHHQVAAATLACASPGPSPSPQPTHLREPLDHITNSLAAAGLQDDAPGSAQRPRAVAQAMAPMTAVKAHMRAETPSSLSSSPFEAMSPSMRELLGKYASSSGGPPTQYSGTPFSHSAATTPPPMGQLTPAFEAARLAAAEQVAPAAVAELTPPGAGVGGAVHTPEAGGAGAGWQADPSMVNALTATAKKLAAKPDFMEQYRQRFPHIVASTERLLASVEKQPAPAPSSTVIGDGGGPMVALAAAATAAAAHHQQQHPQQGPGMSRLGACAGAADWHGQEEEETTMQLYSQVISSRSYPEEAPAGFGQPQQPGQPSLGSLTPPRPAGAAATAAGEQGGTPSTEALLSRVFSATGAGSGVSAGPAGPPLAAPHPISALSQGSGAAGAGDAAAAAPAPPPSAAAPLKVRLPQQPAPPAAAAAASSAPRTDRSRQDLHNAIEAALRGRPVVVPAAAAADFAPLPAAPSTQPSAAATPAPVVHTSDVGLAAVLQPQPPSVVQPRLAEAVAAATAAATPAPAAALPQEVPPLRLVAEQEYAALPTFIRGQLPLKQVNEVLAAVHAAAAERASAGGAAGFVLEDLEAMGLGAKAKVFINCAVKLGRAHLKVVRGLGTLYLLL